MKNSVLFYNILLFAILLVSYSCEKDPDDSSSLLPGKWDHISTNRIDYTDNVLQLDTTITYEAGKLVLEIYDNGTASRFRENVISDSFYWITEGNIFITKDDNGVELKSEYVVSETDLTLKWALLTTMDGHIHRSDYTAAYKRAQ